MQGYAAHYADLLELIGQYKTDIVFLQETMTGRDALRIAAPWRLHLVQRPGPNQRFGGLGVVYRRSLPLSLIAQCSTTLFQAALYRLGDLAMVNVYISPTTSLADFRDALDQLRSLLDNAPPRLMLCGDLNCNLGLLGTPNAKGNAMSELLADYNLAVRNPVATPTYHGTRSGSCIDYIATTFESPDATVHLANPVDHSMLLLLVPTRVSQPAKPPAVAYSKLADNSIREATAAAIDLETCASLRDVSEELLQAALSHIGTLRHPSGRPPWWSAKITRLVRRKRRAECRTEFNYWHKVLRKAIKEAKLRLAHKLELLDGDKAIWKTWRVFSSSPPTTVLDPAAAAAYWSDVMRTRLAPTADDFLDDLHYTLNAPEHRFTLADLNAAIARLRTKRACGPDRINGSLYQLLDNRARQHLVDIVNRDSLADTNGTLCLIHKSGSRSAPGNYRPIVLLNHQLKLLEYLHLPALETFCRDILSPSQNGFIGNASTSNHALRLRLLQQIQKHRQLPLFAAFLDMEKAYDSVEPLLLLRKLRHLRVPQFLYRFIAHLLRPRRYDFSGFDVRASRGVPQGGVLSPLLFNIFINDLLEELDTSELGIFLDEPRPRHYAVLAYADDLVLVSDKADNLQRLLDICISWATRNGQRFSATKSKVMSLAYGCTTMHPPLLLGDDALEYVEEFHYLGYTFRPTAAKVPVNLTKARRSAGLIRQIALYNPFLSAAALLNLYQVTCVPQILYSCNVHPTSHFRDAEAFHIRTLKWILRAYKSDSRDHVLEFCGTETLTAQLERRVNNTLFRAQRDETLVSLLVYVERKRDSGYNFPMLRMAANLFPGALRRRPARLRRSSWLKTPVAHVWFRVLHGLNPADLPAQRCPFCFQEEDTAMHFLYHAGLPRRTTLRPTQDLSATLSRWWKKRGEARKRYPAVFVAVPRVRRRTVQAVVIPQ